MNKRYQHRAPVDQLIAGIDTFLRTTTGNITQTPRKTPAASMPEHDLTPEERETAGRLMRVNHCGEVCAQALYQGQALTAKNRHTRQAMEKAASEEVDHLRWCQERLDELDTPVSRLNPLFYAASFTAGAVTGLLGDRVNLGFVAATEAEVCKHLEDHIEKLPADDERSRAVLEAMRDDEKQHENEALSLGGARYPGFVKRAMAATSKVMTRSTYWI